MKELSLSKMLEEEKNYDSLFIGTEMHHGKVM